MFRVACSLSLLFAFLTSCVVSPLGGSKVTAKTDAGAQSDGSAGPDVASPDSGKLRGAFCGRDPQTGVELCLAVSTCPDVVVDRDLFPECGYRLKDNAFDLVCLCQGYLCPVGVPQTCEDIPKLFSEQSVLTICAQINEGRCTRVPPKGM
jgi:hypothetical protein